MTEGMVVSKPSSLIHVATCKSPPSTRECSFRSPARWRLQHKVNMKKACVLTASMHASWYDPCCQKKLRESMLESSPSNRSPVRRCLREEVTTHEACFWHIYGLDAHARTRTDTMVSGDIRWTELWVSTQTRTEPRYSIRSWVCELYRAVNSVAYDIEISLRRHVVQ